MIAQHAATTVLRWASYYFFALIFMAILVSNVSLLPVFLKLDWTNIQTFIEALRIILFWVIGIEFARLLIEYKTRIVIELLIFVIARKMLLMEDDIYAVAVGSVTIALLIVVWHYLQNNQRPVTGTISE